MRSTHALHNTFPLHSRVKRLPAGPGPTTHLRLHRTQTTLWQLEHSWRCLRLSAIVSSPGRLEHDRQGLVPVSSVDLAVHRHRSLVLVRERRRSLRNADRMEVVTVTSSVREALTTPARLRKPALKSH